MRFDRIKLLLPAVALCAGPLHVSAQQQTGSQAQWQAVEQAMGRKGTSQPGNVMRFSFPRTDLAVSVGDVALKPAFALGSWIAFREVGKGSAMAMGDLVLLEAEIDPVMRALQAGGVEQSALHNHVLGESPRIMYMHIAAHGDPVTIARAVHEALAHSKTPLGAAPPAALASAEGLDTAAIARALGTHGKLNGVVYQISVPRSERITERGHEVPPSMGVATAINFQPTAAGRAAIAGDFVLVPDEVNRVIRVLQSHGVKITALHSHMLDESPRLMFMHFWANDDAVKLARGLGAALRETNSKHSH